MSSDMFGPLVGCVLVLRDRTRTRGRRGERLVLRERTTGTGAYRRRDFASMLPPVVRVLSNRGRLMGVQRDGQGCALLAGRVGRAVDAGSLEDTGGVRVVPAVACWVICAVCEAVWVRPDRLGDVLVDDRHHWPVALGFLVDRARLAQSGGLDACRLVRCGSGRPGAPSSSLQSRTCRLHDRAASGGAEERVLAAGRRDLNDRMRGRRAGPTRSQGSSGLRSFERPAG